MRLRRDIYIVDELTDKPLSKQEKWQLRNAKEDKCIICGDKRDYFVVETETYALRCKRCTDKINAARREKWKKEHPNAKSRVRVRNQW